MSSEVLTIPMRAAGVCARELLDVIEKTHLAGMPLAPLSVRKCADKVLEAVLSNDCAAKRRALLITAASALLMVAAMDAATEDAPTHTLAVRDDTTTSRSVCSVCFQVTGHADDCTAPNMP